MKNNTIIFDKGTNEDVKQLITSLYWNNPGRAIRLRIFEGDPVTGRAWMEEYNVMGYLGMSRGSAGLYPILVNNTRSSGGFGLNTARILKVIRTDTARVLYCHPLFNLPHMSYNAFGDVPEYPVNVYAEATLQARFKDIEQARRYIDFMEGKRFSK